MLSRWARLFAETGVPWRPVGQPPADKQELGEEARRLLDNPVLHEAIGRVERKLIDTWKSSDPADAKGRETIFASYWALHRIRGELQVMIANAGMAARQRAE